MRGRRGVARAGCALVLAAGAVAASLAAAELALRVFVPQPLLHDPDAFLPDPVLGARLAPGFADRVVTTEFASDWIINADGHRGPRAGERGPFAIRVVALGDSFTFGYGVEERESWPRRLEAMIGEGRASTARVEVLNFGVGGYGTSQEAILLSEIAPRLRPDLAIVALYVGNDPEDNLREASRAGAGGAVPAGPPRTESIKRWLGARLQLYSFVSTRADELLVRVGLRRLVYPFEMEILRDPAPAHVEQAWDATRSALGSLAEAARRSGTRVVVAVVPMKHQVSDTVWGRLRSHYADLTEARPAYDREAQQRAVMALCARAGLEAIDLLPGLRSSGEGGALYWPRDQHWNVAGHAAAARILASWFEREAIRPADPRGSGSR